MADTDQTKDQTKELVFTADFRWWTKIEDITQGQGKQKFHIAEATNIYFVIEEDGTEVDDEYLASTKGEMLMWLEESDTWSSVTPSSSATAPLATVQNSDVTLALIESLREENRKRRPTKQSLEHRKAKEYTIHVGWKHYSYKDKTYHLIKGCKEGLDLGPRPMKFNRYLTVKEILPMLKGIFFPNSRNYLGHAKHFTFQIGNFDNTSLDENIKVSECVSGAGRCRVYLLSKKKLSMTTLHSDSDSDFLPEINIRRSRRPAHTLTSPEAGVHFDSDTETTGTQASGSGQHATGMQAAGSSQQTGFGQDLHQLGGVDIVGSFGIGDTIEVENVTPSTAVSPSTANVSFISTGTHFQNVTTTVAASLSLVLVHQLWYSTSSPVPPSALYAWRGIGMPS